ncbi:ubiquinone biosynthesis protein COQ9 [Ascobolus immersus RN42]|uniref:Ubiquinone biosynthesis protein n=1 Tax=Ascobolus immersus RN42 TaxID=1160509 RepID=A0A3N4IE15_ASCIM|nr:ubiquinone biosynthesis protein COQ9 [Ascobolus immersus RN42]
MALRTTTRPLLSALARPTARSYHSIQYPADPLPHNKRQQSILDAALTHVPTYGFSSECIAAGCRDNGYLDATTNLFPRGAMDLISYFFAKERVALKGKAEKEGLIGGGGRVVGELVKLRLKGNVEAGVVGELSQALAIMAMPSNVPIALKELSLLSDEIWWLAGDKSVDMNWYTKRGSLAAIYGATEIFMTKDSSPDYQETWKFLEHRLSDVHKLGSVAGGFADYASFTAGSVISLLRSKSLLK